MTPTPPIIRNGTFSVGTSGWQTSSANSRVLYDTVNKCALLGGLNNERAFLSQTIDLPDTATTLTYKAMITTQETDVSVSGDFFQVIIATDVDTPVRDDIISTTLQASGWIQATHDISDFQGQSITLIFSIETDDSLPSSVRIDDVVVY